MSDRKVLNPKLPTMNLYSILVRPLIGLCLTVLLVLPVPVLAANPDSPGGHHDSPVFFEMFADEYIEINSSRDNLTLLPEGKVLIPPFEMRELGDFFTWSTGRNWNKSWALRLQDFYYLLPLIETHGENHRNFVKNWFLEWYMMHQDYQKPNNGAWEYMTTGIRAMILVYFLKKEEMREPQDKNLITTLRRSLKEHQKYLVVDSHFDDNSNHGMWEAIALVELDRVFPEPKYKELGLARLLLLVRKSVSKLGVHQEHSPAYHFVFMTWLRDYTVYLKSIPNLNWDKLHKLEKFSQAMLEASYFLQDHHGYIPLIGDSDEQKVADRFVIKKTRDTDGLFFDKESGFAIFKDHKRSRTMRYIIFSIQNRVPQLPHHFHDDALAVYFNYDGEVLLSDQGKYSYTRSDDRKYFVSCGAHNVVVPPSFLKPELSLNLKRGAFGIMLVNSPWFRSTSDRVVMGAKFKKNYRVNDQLPCKLFETPGQEEPAADRNPNHLQDRQPGGRQSSIQTLSVNRRITIPRGKPELLVEDMVSGNSPAVLVWNIGPDVIKLERLEIDALDAGRRFEWRLVTKKRKRFKLTLEVDGEVAADEVTLYIKRGETSPVFGWYAPQFMKKVPSTVILLLLKKPSEVWVTTRLVKIR